MLPLLHECNNYFAFYMKTTQESIKEKIKASLPSLPANQKIVAQYFLDNMHLVPLIPIKEIAKRADVSQPSIVRFAQSLGYKGYKQLKDEIADFLESRLAPYEEMPANTEEKSDIHQTLKLVTAGIVENIYKTVNSVDGTSFDEIVSSIIKAERIYCLGLEISAHFSRLLAFLLRLYGYDAHYVSLEFLHYKEQIAFMSKKDLLIAFTFSPYSREAAEAVKFASEQNVPVITFTDKMIAPATQFANNNIFIKTDRFMFGNSFASVLVIFNAILAELTSKDNDRVASAMRTLEANIVDEQYLIVDKKRKS